MSKKITVAFAGLGSRGTSYAEACALLKDKIEIVACADIIPGKVTRFAEKYGVPAEGCYSSAEEMLQKDRLADVMFICTMDKQHYGHAIPALEKDYHLVLEKPASTDPRECMEIARVANERGRHVVVCHVLRYTPYYRKLKEIIDSGMLGKIYSIQACEGVGYWHMAHSFVRGNWRNSDETSPMILQKCCHDMDIFLWLTGKHCKSVSSFGHLSHFKPECAPEGAHEHCTEECPAYSKCPYSIERYLHHAKAGCFGWPLDVVSPATNYDDFRRDLLAGPYSRCVYHCDNNVVDHQVVNLQFEDDLTLSFSMSAFDQRGRNTAVMGTEGFIDTTTDASVIRVVKYNQGIESYEEFNTEAETDQFGHGGGDYILVKELVDLLNGEVSVASTCIDDSVESHIVALAVEKSRTLGGALVSIDDYVKTLN